MGRPKLWKYLSKEATDAFYATDHPDEKAAYVPVVSLASTAPSHIRPSHAVQAPRAPATLGGFPPEMGFANDAPDGRVTTVSVLLVNAGNQSRLPLLRWTWAHSPPGSSTQWSARGSGPGGKQPFLCRILRG